MAKIEWGGVDATSFVIIVEIHAGEMYTCYELFYDGDSSPLKNVRVLGSRLELYD